jgi:hypothetical protein
MKGREALGRIPKTSLDRAKEHRQDAYATLASRTVERSLRAIPGALAVHLR